MGGIGSGNRLQWASYVSLNGFLCIDVRHFARNGLLRDGSQFGLQWSRHGEKCGDLQVEAHPHSIALKYRSRRGSDEWTDNDYRVPIQTTPCHLGGKRDWFLCPAQGCGRARCQTLWGQHFRLSELLQNQLSVPKRKPRRRSVSKRGENPKQIGLARWHCGRFWNGTP